MILVLDASAAFEIILQKENAQLFRQITEKADWVLAPDIYVSEITNTAWKYFQFGVLKSEESVSIAETGINLVDDFVSSKELWKEALAESIRFKHSVYYILYLITARRNNGRLLSIDKKLIQIAKGVGIEVN